MTSRAKKEYAAGGELWIKGAIKNPGSLHRELDVPMDKTIPVKRLRRAAHSKNLRLKRKAVLAENLRSFQKK